MDETRCTDRTPPLQNLPPRWDAERTEDRLDRARLLRRALIASSHDAIVASDEAGRIVIFNHAAEALLKLDAAAVIGQRRIEHLLPADAVSALHRAPSHTVIDEIHVTAADGETIPVRLSGAMITRGIDPPGVAVFLTDLRPIKRLEQENLRAAALAAVGQTVAGLAHSIKNILIGLEGGVYVYRTGLSRSNDDLADRGWQAIERNVKRVSSMVKGLLALSKTNAAEHAPADPRAVVADVLELIKPAADAAGVEIGVEAPPVMAPVLMDPEGINTCLENLVCNALDACRDSESRPARISIRTWVEDEDLRFEVSDNGAGMDDALAERVRAGCYTSKGSRGNGLGLMIARKIVCEHGGTIDFRSRPDEGTVFTIAIPAARTEGSR